MNRALQTYYGILREACPEAVWVVPRDEPALAGLLFTDTGYEYGAVPSHLNEYANRKIAGLIAKKLFAEKGAGS